jgi:uncharacterized protein DUF4240
MALLAVAIAAVVGAYAVGSRQAETGIADVSDKAPAAAATPVAEATATASAPAEKGMSEPKFFGLVDDTRAEADGDTGRQSELIDERLRQLPPQQIVAFERIRRGLDRQLYTWDIWGAAYVIEDGCSDDCFRDFRAYVISLGRGAYETALRNPDGLAGTVQDAETGEWENADDVAPDAYQSVTGDDFPSDSSDLDGDPRGQPWDDEQVEALVQRYPRLAARFR